VRRHCYATFNDSRFYVRHGATTTETCCHPDFSNGIQGAMDASVAYYANTRSAVLHGIPPFAWATFTAGHLPTSPTSSQGCRMEMGLSGYLKYYRRALRWPWRQQRVGCTRGSTPPGGLLDPVGEYAASGTVGECHTVDGRQSSVASSRYHAKAILTSALTASRRSRSNWLASPCWRYGQNELPSCPHR